MMRDYVFEGEEGGDRAGLSVSTAGDVDGDGLDDILVGAYFAPATAGSGKAYLILGSSLGENSTINLSDADYSITGGSGYKLGHSVSSAGDIDGDGLDDILIGNPGDNSVYVVTGGDLSSHTMSAKYVIYGEGSSDNAGVSVSEAGDVDGDGLSDILIGANGANKAYLVLGSSISTTSSLASADYIFSGGGDQLSHSVSTAGDVDGDGLSDLLLGAMYNDDSANNAGKIFLVLSSSLGTANTFDLSSADYAFEGENEQDQLSLSFEAGDIDGDGLTDLLIASDLNGDGGSAAGKVYLILAGSLGTATTFSLADADYTFEGESPSDTLRGIAGIRRQTAMVWPTLLSVPTGTTTVALALAKPPPPRPQRLQHPPPEGTTISIDPDDPVEDVDDLVCEIDEDAYDAEGDSISYTIEWEVDGVSYTDATTTTETGDTVPAEDIFFEEEWTCIVTPNDGDEDGAPTETSVIVATDCWFAEFNGSSSYMDAYDISESDGTIAFWFYVNDSTVRNQFLTNDWIGSHTMSAHIWSSGSAGFSITRSGWTHLTDPSSVSAGTWYHMVMAWDGSTMELWMDGVLVDSASKGYPNGRTFVWNIGRGVWAALPSI